LLGLLAALSPAALAEPATMQPAPSTQPPLGYVLSKNAENADPAIRARIVEAMDRAVATYNRHATISKRITANYNAKVPIAEGNYDDWISFGGQIGYRTALHEISHTLGVGTHPRWRSMIRDGRWTGQQANAQLREFDGPDAVLHADRAHFWPYGLNYDREWKPDADRRHVLMVAAIRRDLGLDDGPPPATRPATGPAATAPARD
jgi:hypothetical protein